MSLANADGRDVWIVLVEDRHADVDPMPFSTEDAAIHEARESAARNAINVNDVVEEQLTTASRRDDWVLCLSYSPEGDRVRVVRRRMDAGVRR